MNMKKKVMPNIFDEVGVHSEKIQAFFEARGVSDDVFRAMKNNSPGYD